MLYELLELDWSNQTDRFEKEWNFNVRKVNLICEARYFRSPHWSVGVDIILYFDDCAGKGYFNKEIIAESMEVIDDYTKHNTDWESYSLQINEYVSFIYETIEKIKFIDKEYYSKPGIFNYISNMVSGKVTENIDEIEIFNTICEGLKGATEEEKTIYQKSIDDHNMEVDKFHKENPLWFMEQLLKPGFGSLFANSESLSTFSEINEMDNL